MPGPASTAQRKFHIELIKPSHYDDQGYVIQWWKAWVPSNSLACLYGLADDLSRKAVLGEGLELVVNAYDEVNTILPIRKIARRVRGGKGIVFLVGVQSNQVPRAVDIARHFRAAGAAVAIGGFHVSGCLSMLKELPPDIQEALDLGITLFAGEAEGRLQDLLADALSGSLKPVYNYLDDLPGLEGQVVPFLPKRMVERYDGLISSFDAGRGCPFQCSFCTIINVQGRKSRYRSADDVEALVRANAAQGIHRFFITDDNFARNRNWEAIFDRLIELREKQGLRLRFLIQVDTLCHKIPNFVEKAARAGCTHVFIGLENLNPDNLIAAKKRQNRITEYRLMFQLWRQQGIITYAGFIIGFPADTPETIRRDIRIIQNELPVDLLEFTILTPLPGSEDHKVLHERGVWMDPDLNKYDLEHVTTRHATTSRETLQETYRNVWEWYYTPEHVERLMRRAAANGIKPVRIWQNVLQVYGSMRFEGIHPQQGGYLRRKVRTQRRRGLPIEGFLPFHARRLRDALSTYGGFLGFAVSLHRMRKRVERDPAAAKYVDLSLSPVQDPEGEELEMFSLGGSSRIAVATARARASRKKDANREVKAAAQAARL